MWNVVRCIQSVAVLFIFVSSKLSEISAVRKHCFTFGSNRRSVAAAGILLQCMSTMAASVAARRLPTVFVNHGGGPMPLLGDANHSPLVQYLKSFRHRIQKPKALLVISAHWEEPVVTVSSGEHPEMIYDYYGFPPESYQFKYPAPGSPSLAHRVAGLLKGAGIKAVERERGYDHGTFVPLLLMYPDADIPVVQVSLHASLDPKLHVQMGKALEPLRDDGVLILGSGMSFHNMRVFMQRLGGGRHKTVGQAFTEYLTEACRSPDESNRTQLLSKWKSAPGGQEAHPREEHLIPLMVAAGAAGSDVGVADFSMSSVGCDLVGFTFGAQQDAQEL